MTLDFRLLGAFEVVRDGVQVDLGGMRGRTLCAALLLSANQPVSIDRLCDAVWGDELPDSARGSLRVLLSRLRSALGAEPDRLVTKAPGYELRASPAEVDAARFEDVLDAGTRELRSGDAERAAATLREALALWRGPALVEFADRPFARPEAARLDELQLAALELRIEADLAAGHAGALVGELESLTAQHPLREQLLAHRMVALYRCGRQVDALRAYSAFRDEMVEVGLEPGPAVRELEAAILRQDTGLLHPGSRERAAPPAGAAVRVMLVDDHPMWREATRALLERQGFAVVAEAEDGTAAVVRAAESRPDVILMDLHLPGQSGDSAARAIIAEIPGVKVLMLSSSGEEGDVLAALRAGAVGYLLKTGSAAEVVDAVTRASRGDAVFTSSLAAKVLDEVRSVPDAPALTTGQRNVLRLLSRGLSTRGVADQLGVDEDAVRAEVSAVLSDLQRAPGAPWRAVRTVMFIDVVGSTQVNVGLGDASWRALLHRYHQLVGDIVRRCHGRIVKTLGDGVLALFVDPDDAINAGIDIQEEMRGLGLDGRIGIHAGECEVTPDDVHGLSVTIASRVAAVAGPGETLISQTVRDLVLGSAFRLVGRGTHALRGVPGEWALFGASGVDVVEREGTSP